METVIIKRRLDLFGKNIGYPLAQYLGFDSRKDPSLPLYAHEHDGFEITYVFKGTVVWELENGIRLRLNGGDMALIQPGVVHKGYLDLIQPATLFWLSTPPLSTLKQGCCGLSKDEIRRLDSVLSRGGDLVWYAGEQLHRSLVLLYHQLVHWKEEGKSTAGRMLLPGIRGLLTHALIQCASIVSAEGVPRSIGEYVQAARSFIQQHVGDGISMNDVADRVGVSVSRLHAIFREQTGLTPNDYLQRLRVETAQDLLGRTEDDITEIALDLGFTTSQYFATCFKKYTGMTPREFRKKTK